MTRHFSLPTVLRMVPNSLLKEFFEKFPWPCYSLDWRRLGERSVQPLVRVLELWPPDAQEAVEIVLRNVFRLACPSGFEAICDAAVHLGCSGLRDELPEYGNLYHRALWTWLEHPGVFDQAVALQRVEELAFWRKRGDVPKIAPRTDPDALRLLAAEVSRLLMREQMRGQQCSIEHFHRDNGTDYFFCYPDDYVRDVLMHNEHGELVTRPVRSTFEVAFAYQRREGTLEVSAGVPSRLKTALEDAFAGLILDERLGPRRPCDIYDLNRLKDSTFRLETDPADRVHARLRWVQVDFRDRSGRFRIDAWTGERRNFPELVEDYLNPDRIPLDDIDVSAVALQFRFEATAQRKAGSMTVHVSSPDRCNLRSQPFDRQRIVRKHLRLWRLARE